MSNPKELRKQLRNVVQDQLPELLKTEILDLIDKKLVADADLRLTKVEEYVHGRMDEMNVNASTKLEEMNGRSKAIHGYIMREVAVNLLNQMNNAHITMLAWQELMQEKLGITDVEAFNKELDARKTTINDREQAKALAGQQEAIKATEAATQNDARNAAPTEPPVSPAPTTEEGTSNG